MKTHSYVNKHNSMSSCNDALYISRTLKLTQLFPTVSSKPYVFMYILDRGEMIQQTTPGI